MFKIIFKGDKIFFKLNMDMHSIQLIILKKKEA